MMSDALKRVAIRGSVALSAALLLHACAPVDSAEKTDAKAERQVIGTADADVSAERPEGAVPIEGDLYAIPLAVDKEGCELFGAWSETGAVPLGQPIYYHDGNGSFSQTRSTEASCNATMVDTGSDGDGCPTFRAEQPDGSSTDATYFRSQSEGYTTNKERSTCGS